MYWPSVVLHMEVLAKQTMEVDSASLGLDTALLGRMEPEVAASDRRAVPPRTNHPALSAREMEGASIAASQLWI